MINRRKFCRDLALTSAILPNILNQSFDIMLTKNSQKSRYRWVILYWMPYDNDLVRFGEEIIEMITRGNRSSEIAVVVQSDYWGDTHMRRRLIVEGKIEEIGVILGEDSSDISAFSNYLDWANQNFEAEHWAVIIVGHSGRMNEISPDDRGGTNQTPSWMKVDSFANVLSQFNQTMNRRVELLFFQNCNKATLEVIYEARNCAKYTLASQLLLGAPNYYYGGFLRRLQDPSVGGHEAAIAIADSERADMYHTLTLTDNRAVEQIPDKLSRLVRFLLDSNLPSIKPSELSLVNYFSEQHCDALVLLSYLSKSSDRADLEFTEFAHFLTRDVMAFHQKSERVNSINFDNDATLDKFNGLSLYLPKTKREVNYYRSLALYEKVDLVKLYQRLV